MYVFWEHGYEGASLRRLVDATGLKPGSVYGAFGSKGGLFREALSRYLDGVRVQLGLAGRSSPADVLRQWVRSHAAASVGPPPRGCLLFHAAATRPSLDAESADAVAHALRAHQRTVRRLLAAHHGEPSDDALHGRAWLVTSSMAGTSALARAGATRDEVLATAEATLHAVGVANVRQNPVSG